MKFSGRKKIRADFILTMVATSPSNPSKTSFKKKVKELFEGIEGDSFTFSFKSEGDF